MLKKKPGKRLTEQDKSDIIELKRTTRISDQKIALQYDVDRSTITKLVNRVKRDDLTLNGEGCSSLEVTRAAAVANKRDDAFAKKLKLVEESLFDWHTSALHDASPVSSETLKKKALHILQLLNEKSVKKTSGYLLNAASSSDWFENDYNALNSGDDESKTLRKRL